MNAFALLELVGEVAPPDPAVLERLEATLQAAIGEAVDAPPAAPLPSAVPTVSRRHTRRHRGARLAVAATAVAIAGTATAVLLPGGPGPAAPSAAAAEFGHLALVAAAQPPPAPPGPGQYQYTESVEADTSTTVDSPTLLYTVQVPETRQIWIAPDGSGRLVESFGTPVFLSTEDKAAWVQAGSPDLAEAPSDESFGPGGLSDGPVDLSTLPTDPTALGALISARKVEGGPPGPAEDFTQVGDLLRETDASPALRAALYQVAAGLPGIDLLGNVTDHSGRPGVGLAYVSGGTRHELIFDPSTAALLGEEDVVVGPTPGATEGAAYAPGTVMSWAVYLMSDVVDSTGAGPQTAPAPAAPAPSGADSPGLPEATGTS